MARMRLLKEAVTEIKAADPNTALTESALRTMAKRGEIFTVKIGNRFLVNLDLLEAYLSSKEFSTQPVIHRNGIRQIPERI